jgi:hypothetical protein
MGLHLRLNGSQDYTDSRFRYYRYGHEAGVALIGGRSNYAHNSV